MSSAAKKTSAAAPAKKAAPAPAAAKKGSKRPASAFHKEHAHLFPKAPRHFGIGRSARPAKDLSRFVKWPRYVRIQRQRSILKKRLKVPPSINQFTKAVDKNQASTLFRLLAHYRPESTEEKAKRLKAKAEAGVKGKADVSKTEKPMFVKVSRATPEATTRRPSESQRARSDAEWTTHWSACDRGIREYTGTERSARTPYTGLDTARRASMRLDRQRIDREPGLGQANHSGSIDSSSEASPC